MINLAEYDCKFGPDVEGLYISERVQSNIALNCGTFCECEGLTNNVCLFGPDNSGGFFIDNNVRSEQVDVCQNDRLECLCDKHADVVTKMEEE